jgi:HAE1 family hydrophobic/amphiphilic exporter-1
LAKASSFPNCRLFFRTSAIYHQPSRLQKSFGCQANLQEGYNSTVVSKLLEEKVNKENILPKDYSIEFGGEVEDIDQSFSELWNSMFVAVLLILLILVLQFNSFRQPFIIMLTLPLAIIGVVVGMLLFGLSFSMTVFIGIIALAGIVVNDAIVLIDKALRNVKELNMKPRQAIMNAGWPDCNRFY